jgi:hypothetical protein
MHTPLFTLERSENKNYLIYELNFRERFIDQKNPVTVYWDMVENGGKLEPLNSLEKKRAYGIDIHEVKKDSVVFSILPVPEFKLTVQKRICRAVNSHYAFWPNEKDHYVKKIFVHMKSFIIIPKIERVDIVLNHCHKQLTKTIVIAE